MTTYCQVLLTITGQVVLEQRTRKALVETNLSACRGSAGDSRRGSLTVALFPLPIILVENKAINSGGLGAEPPFTSTGTFDCR